MSVESNANSQQLRVVGKDDKGNLIIKMTSNTPVERAHIPARRGGLSKSSYRRGESLQRGASRRSSTPLPKINFTDDLPTGEIESEVVNSKQVDAQQVHDYPERRSLRSFTRNQIKVFRRVPEARLPTKTDPTNPMENAGFDLYSAVEATIPSKTHLMVDTGISMQFQPSVKAHRVLGLMGCGVHLKIASRSGLSSKNGIEVGAGIIDPGYTGPVKVILHNNGPDEFKVSVGDRIAQVIPYVFAFADIVECEEADLEKTSRGQKGFGSSGVQD